jgi:hydrogenase expression/formation protein HypC
MDGNAGQLAMVDVVGAQRPINIGMLEETVAADDWVLIHMGFALERIDALAAEKALAGLEMLGRPRSPSVDG